MSGILRDGQRLVFAGDSITDAGRRGAHQPLGNGFVRLVHDRLAARFPAMKFTMLNAGVGGNTIRHLAARWDRDVIEAQPDRVTLLIGVNDAWGWIVQREGCVSPREYRDIYADLLTRLKRQTRATLVLMDPFLVGRIGAVIEDHRRMLEVLPRYRATVHAMARRFDARHLRLQAIFDQRLNTRSAASLAGDAIHPTDAGHAIIARAWLRATPVAACAAVGHQRTATR
jgi:lysophospholipase L1-like esterase